MVEPAIKVKLIFPEEAAKRREMARLRQRKRRQKWVRIDYYPDEHAFDIIQSVLNEYSPCNSYSATINHIIREWARRRKRV